MELEAKTSVQASEFKVDINTRTQPVKLFSCPQASDSKPPFIHRAEQSEFSNYRVKRARESDFHCFLFSSQPPLSPRSSIETLAGGSDLSGVKLGKGS